MGKAAARGRGQRGLARPRQLLMFRPAAGPDSLEKRPRHCRARSAAVVTVRPWSRTRARERCGVRSSPSPALPAAAALVARGAAATTAAAPAPHNRAPRAPGGNTQCTARRPLPCRLPALRDVSTSCRTQRAPELRSLRQEKECAHPGLRRPLPEGAPVSRAGREGGFELLWPQLVTRCSLRAGPGNRFQPPHPRPAGK